MKCLQVNNIPTYPVPMWNGASTSSLTDVCVCTCADIRPHRYINNVMLFILLEIWPFGLKNYFTKDGVKLNTALHV